MKLAHLQEARYHGPHPIVQWVKEKRALPATHTYGDYADIPDDQLETVIADLTSEFGAPTVYEDHDDRDRYTWDHIIEWEWNLYSFFVTVEKKDDNQARLFVQSFMKSP